MLKLYVLIRDDMTEAQQAVQAGHAVAKFGLDHHKEFKAWQEGNNTLIYLSVKNLGWWKQALDDGEFKHSMFYDPDIFIAHPGRYPFRRPGDYTAIAVAPNWTCQYVLFKSLPLALRPKTKKWWQRS